jgi:hypothetical protein
MKRFTFALFVVLAGACGGPVDVEVQRQALLPTGTYGCSFVTEPSPGYAHIWRFNPDGYVDDCLGVSPNVNFQVAYCGGCTWPDGRLFGDHAVGVFVRRSTSGQGVQSVMFGDHPNGWNTVNDGINHVIWHFNNSSNGVSYIPTGNPNSLATIFRVRNFNNAVW